MLRILLASVLVTALWAAPDPGVVARTQAGETLPLGAVLREIGERFPGHALDAQMREQDGRPVYRIKWLGNDGKVRDITVDARTAQLLRVR